MDDELGLNKFLDLSGPGSVKAHAEPSPGCCTVPSLAIAVESASGARLEVTIPVAWTEAECTAFLVASCHLVNGMRLMPRPDC